tara:strand:+ start:716 stop:1039 length:324 start_codon:yes stop_codon:yes gene_type:complete
MSKILLATILLSLSMTASGQTVLDDLIIKKKPVINQMIIELILAGLSDDTENNNLELAKEICLAGEVSEYSCTRYDGLKTIAQAINEIPFKDRTFWWDRFRDQYGHY